MRYTYILIAASLALAGCKTELKPASIKVEDEIRHYYPIETGKILTLNYEIENTGDEPLVISEIQSTCGCISSSKGRMIIPAGQKTDLEFKYDSSKNIGYVSHEILLYGNFDTTGVYKLYFDVNVVPDAGYTRDYESMSRHDDKRNYYTDTPEL